MKALLFIRIFHPSKRVRLYHLAQCGLPYTYNRGRRFSEKPGRQGCLFSLDIGPVGNDMAVTAAADGIFRYVQFWRKGAAYTVVVLASCRNMEQ